MRLTPGTRLGPYEIVSPVGAGGMGEVYRACDTRLDRIVAIKVLNGTLAVSPELTQRFEREARAISQLQHPHICTLYDVGHHDGTDYLVIEFLDGETLADRLAKGALPIDQALKIAIEIAGALDHAHRAGIVHRDLKPGNVMLTRSGAKLLDFGLAKGTARAGGASAAVLSAAPTMTSPSPQSPLTVAGAVLGTMPYMSPEQLQGSDADARSDIFAYGAMLYEMTTGQRAFQGKSQIKVASAILEDDPPKLRAIAPSLPKPLEHIVDACLAKDPNERIQSAHDVKLQMQWVAELSVPAPVSASEGRAALTWSVAAVLAITAVAALAFETGYIGRREATPIYQSSLLPPEGTTVAESGIPVLSPDGTKLAFVARPSKGQPILYVRALNSLAAQALSGTQGATYPFWSPDSHSLAFFADGKLMRIDASGGPAQALADAPRGRGGTWGSDGTILYVPGIATPIMRVPASGGTAEAASKLLDGELGHRWPYFLPDGKHYLFWARGRHPMICVGELSSLQRKVLFENDTNAIYANGRLLFVRDSTLMAQLFSVRQLATMGDAVPLAERVTTTKASFCGMFSASKTGQLVYESGAQISAPLIWYDASGKMLGNQGESADYSAPAISPDGQQVAVGIRPRDGSFDVWIIDLKRGTKTRLTHGQERVVFNDYPTWTPDGRQIVFSSTQKGNSDLYIKPADNSKDEQLLFVDDADKSQGSMSDDGGHIAFRRGTSNSEIWGLSLRGERTAFPVVHDQFTNTDPSLSPDGRWLAYTSSENGLPQVYITGFPGGGAKWQVSTNQGNYPRWRSDGRELYFVDNGNAIMAVDVSAHGDAITLGTPHQLIQADLKVSWGPYDVTRDGKKFLVNSAGQESPPRLVLVTDWLGQLKK